MEIEDVEKASIHSTEEIVETIMLIAKTLVDLRKEVRTQHIIEDHTVKTLNEQRKIEDKDKVFSRGQRIIFIDKYRRPQDGTVMILGNKRIKVRLDSGVLVWADKQHLYSQSKSV